MVDLNALVALWSPATCQGSGWWILAPLGWFLVIATFFVFIRFVVFRRRGWGPWGYGPGRGGRMSAVDVLDRRFAEGEITAQEYRNRREILKDEPASDEGKTDAD